MEEASYPPPPPPPSTPVFPEPGFVLVSGDAPAAELPPAPLVEIDQALVGGPVYPPLPQGENATVVDAAARPVASSGGAVSRTAHAASVGRTLAHDVTHNLTWRSALAWTLLAYVAVRAFRTVRRHATRKNLKRLRVRLKQRISLARKGKTYCGDPPEMDP